MEKSQATPSTIYIRLLEEAAVTCIRPTQAELLEDGTYFVLATPEYDPTDEVWEFVPGSRVHCALFDDGPNGAYLLAIAEAGVEGRKKGRSKIAVLQDAIEYRDATGHLLWHIKVENIVLVAEYTTNEGPLVLGLWFYHPDAIFLHLYALLRGYGGRVGVLDDAVRFCSKADQQH
jgi:hypothetical protein